MTRLRTSLIALALGGAALTTGVVATNAVASPAPVTAVEALAPAATAVDAATDPQTADTTTTPQRLARGWWRKLTDAQQACLKKEVGTRPVGPLSDADKEALRAKVTKAAETCDVELPFAKGRAFWNGLTDEQRSCLDKADVQRPWGPLTKGERQAVRNELVEAAKACGITLPAKAPQAS